jgi:hypothetical protein
MRRGMKKLYFFINFFWIVSNIFSLPPPDYGQRIDDFRDSIAPILITQEELIRKYGDNFTLVVENFGNDNSKVYRYIYSENVEFIFFYSGSKKTINLYTWRITPDFIKDSFCPKTKNECIDYFGKSYYSLSNGKGIGYLTDDVDIYFGFSGDDITAIWGN